MRTFWAIIGAVVLLCVALWVLRGGTPAARAPVGSSGAPAESVPPSTPAGESTGGDAATRTSATSESQRAEAIAPAPSAPDAPLTPPAPAPASEAPPATDPLRPEPAASADTMRSISNDLKAMLGGSDPEIAPRAAPVELDHEDALSPSPGAAVGAPSRATAPAAQAPATAPAAQDVASAKAVLEPQDDGSVLVDRRYAMRGKGTQDDPYVVSWEMLVSTQDSYQPRLGRKVIPDRVKMLDGKWVRISGYIAFPIMAQSPEEMLVMLNQWDGCCIGVPPTPYDAIEVKLKAAAKGDERLRTSGTITGVLRVDPYLVKNWLVSLYLMDEGVLSGAGGTATPGQHASGKPSP